MDKIKIEYPDEYWTKEIIDGWNRAFSTTASIMELDLSRTGFITLFDWVTTVAMIEKVLANPNVKTFRIDVKGVDPSNFIPLGDYTDIGNNRPTERFIPQSELLLSRKIYRLLGFIESLGTLDVLNRRRSDGKVFYPSIPINDVRNRRFYTGKTDEPSVLLGLTLINAKEDCAQFLDENNIRNWVQTMAKRFPESPLLESEEIWRVFCHEFAVNIYEHAGIPGFISMRVVSSRDKEGKIHPWCRTTYSSPYMKRLFSSGDGHFLELCIADAGIGFVESLKKSYLDRLRQNDPYFEEDIKNEDILAFAFDELGTSKSEDECWITERHALNRILNITAKYGGILVIRSGGVEMIYSGEGAMFEKKPTGAGYFPTNVETVPASIPGAQLQVILPLTPLNSSLTPQKRSPLLRSLPSSFRQETGHVRGHLVPLLEKLDQPNPCIGREDQQKFRKACDALGKELVDKRASDDPLILDFSQLNWTSGQFETLLYYLQNLLQYRPVLLVEIEEGLADDVIRLESIAAPTTLDNKLIYRKSNERDQYGYQVSEIYFLETYNRIHATVMGVDRYGKYRIFGLKDHAYEHPLLSLIETPKTIQELVNETIWGVQLRENTLKAILNHINPMFERNIKGQWRTVWDILALSNEVRRVMSLHFDEVAEYNHAWRGYPYEKNKSKYKLPWQPKWRPNFLESARILFRDRHADEAAQRLIYRLQKGLEIRGKSLADVKVLACVTAPAMLLASFIYRWWPPRLDRPAVSDLGYYIMLSHPKDLPSIVKAGGIVIVHDILDTGTITGKLIDVLKRQQLDILCMLSFIKMVPGLKETQVTPIESGWNPEPSEDEKNFLPRHAMIWVKSPTYCPPPGPNESDQNTFWIEPRTLRPVRYTSLRRQFIRGKEPDLDRRNRYLEKFDQSKGGCLFAAGHYVYGHRHYLVSVDIRKALTGEIGDEIALWLADICENPLKRPRQDWESKEGSGLKGDVTAVLMPLHSQIHYIWPKVEKILAQRGRRQLSWLLDATMFAGSGPAYRIPPQFQYLISEAVIDACEAQENGQIKYFKPIRILIIDDAVVTARTAETILARITRIVKEEFRRKGVTENIHEYPSPIEWIRYFCVLNQMNHTQHQLWKNLKSVGDTNIKFVFEAYAPFMGVAVHTDSDCPTCKDIERLKRLGTICEQYGFESARQWTDMQLTDLQPVAIDSPGFDSSGSVSLKRGIEILKRKSEGMNTSSKFFEVHAATAIWRFHELMYSSYPPGDILSSLQDAWSTADDGPDEKKEYERYRWAVLEWCLRNWKRLEANASVEDFIREVKREIDKNSPLVEALLEGCSQHYEDPDVTQLIADSIDKLAELELKRTSGRDGAAPERIQRTTVLYTALALFWLNIRPSEWEMLTIRQENGKMISLINYLDNAAGKLDLHGPCFLRNLHRQLKRPQRYADPQWALDIIAETLLRGRDPERSKHGRHHLLPKLIAEILAGGSDYEDRLLLHSSLTLFLAALEDLLRYDFQLSFDAYEVRSLSMGVLDWLKFPAVTKEGSKTPPELRDLRDALDLDSSFLNEFNQTFHEEVENLEHFLQKRVDELGGGRLVFEYRVAVNTKRCRSLIHGQRLRICLANLTIDPIERLETKHKSRIEVARVWGNDGKEKICFHLLTNFASLEDTQRLTGQGQNIKVDQYRLEAFGARFDNEWTPPLPKEQEEGFTASYKIIIPTGFMPGRPS